MRFFPLGIAVLAEMSVLAGPTATVKSVEQNAVTRAVKVTYDLADGDAIVTLDVQAKEADGNYVSIGSKRLRSQVGDVNRLVAAGTGHVLMWYPEGAWKGLMSVANLKIVLSAWSPDSPPDYMVMPLEFYGDDAKAHIRYYPNEDSLPAGIESDLYRTTMLVMRRIPAAGVEWTMGSPEGEPGRMDDREYQVAVRLTQDYYMGVFEVTQMQYGHMRADNAENYFAAIPAEFKTNDNWQTLPVEMTIYRDERGDTGGTWDWTVHGHAVDPNSTLGRLRKKSGVDYELPTEAQWEFAARAGTTAAFYNQTGADYAETDFDEIGWCSANSEGRPHRVGEKKPNAFGLYDMLGNVSERCVDWWKADLRGLGGDNPQGPQYPTENDTVQHPRRGGNWFVSLDYCRVAQRNTNGSTAAYNYNGFRVICPLTLSWDVPSSAVEPSVSEFTVEGELVVATGGVGESAAYGAEESPFDSWVRSLGISNLSTLKTIPPIGFLMFLK